MHGRQTQKKPQHNLVKLTRLRIENTFNLYEAGLING